MPLDHPLPILPETRRSLLYSVIDLIHPHICEREEFHYKPTEECCTCRYCGQEALNYHFRDCEFLSKLTHSALLRTVHPNKN